MSAVLPTLAGTGFMFFMTSLGAAVVFVLKKDIGKSVQRAFLGFAAGIMIAASVWSLIIPAIEEAESRGSIGWIPAAGGIIFGTVFLMIMDALLPHLHLGESKAEGLSSSFKRTTLLVFAVTLHNIPEGMAVGIAFALAAEQGGSPAAYAAAAALAVGMGIQNFPEGAAIALPLREAGFSKIRAFGFGALSALVEPVFGVLTVLLASYLQPVMPWLLSFAAGAMIYVVVEELIPEASLHEHSHVGTVSVIAGFVLMMILDVALG